MILSGITLSINEFLCEPLVIIGTCQPSQDRDGRPIFFRHLLAWLKLFMISDLGKKFKGYNWQKNFGYGTNQHLKAIKILGITKHHRKTFSPINKLK